MNCKHCGGVNKPDAKTCIFCGSELQERETVYVTVYQDAPQQTQMSEQEILRAQVNTEASKAMVLAILSLIFGFIIFRTTFAVLALVSAERAGKAAAAGGVAAPGSVRAAKIISIIALALAGICLLLFLVYIAADATYTLTSSLS